ncbi:2-isopropylmalate synthase [Acidihalobacter yilgarnensis]|uniref:2-isopropylmalate synthase n=1 Tax=Acidihalobacter yilgarnensis TaxID=2819280 RepID=A0A1D8IS40_9GAMM|nr:2-isopropylmalate synthase [Acidihalobacter yilgarnensis]AOU99330.1 2-isopropylmalate synthase [Acidihalobacter yilgarnensis]
MNFDPKAKYRPFEPIELPDRQWPSRVCREAPVWCSVDLRDGNQALVKPMNHDRKARMFALLVQRGFKEIEVGFPAASQTDFDFVRWLIETDRIPEDVTIQVLTQARDALIERSFEALRGARRAIMHLYNSTSPVQRRVVFGLDRAGVIDIAVRGAERVLACARTQPETEWVFQYSPESFTATEPDFAVEICDAVNAVWRPTPARKTIMNLPATVEVSTPNGFADQVEWFSRHVRDRDAIVLSVHPHNDRGCGVAAAELAMLAGADRVEGTLFGNGERTGNVDIVTLALNLYTQGVDPRLDLGDINEIVRVAEYCNQLPVHPRHPYAGELVFTAFSGSHQDAIRKGFAAQRADAPWEVPYLPIDPADLGRSYEAVIRVNSQSGKGGIAYLLEQDYGISLPRRLQIEFARVVQREADATGAELGSADLWRLFQAEYLASEGAVKLLSYREQRDAQGAVKLSATLSVNGRECLLGASGNGSIDAYVRVLEQAIGISIRLVDYREHAAGPGADARAVAYVEIAAADGAGSMFGVGLHDDVLSASLGAVTAAVNRAQAVVDTSPDAAARALSG